MSCTAYNNYLTTRSENISGDIAMRGRVKSLWYTLPETDWWTDGAGFSVTNVVAQRTVADLSSIVTDDYASGDGSLLDGWTRIIGVDSAFSGSGCNPTVGTISNRNKTNTAYLQELALVSDPLCLTKVLASYNSTQQIANAKKNFENNVIDIWAEKNRREYMAAIPDENKFVFTGGALVEGSGGDFDTSAAPDSQVHQDILSHIRTRMIQDGAGEDGAYGMADGTPVFLCIMSEEQQRALIKGNDDIRQDYRYAEPKALLKPFGIGRQYAGLYHAIDLKPARWNLVEGAWVEVPFYTADTDGSAKVNPDYHAATAEDIIFWHPKVYTKLLRRPRFGFGSQVNFKSWNYAGETQWINEYDKECNQFRDNGYWACRMAAAYLESMPYYGYAVRVLRCPNAFGTTACPA